MRLDLGISLNKFPKTVAELIMESLPWTITLLIVTTVLSFVIGNLLGAVAAWPRAPNWLRAFATPFVLFQGVPPVRDNSAKRSLIGFFFDRRGTKNTIVDAAQITSTRKSKRLTIVIGRIFECFDLIQKVNRGGSYTAE